LLYRFKGTHLYCINEKRDYNNTTSMGKKDFLKNSSFKDEKPVGSGYWLFLYFKAGWFL